MLEVAASIDSVKGLRVSNGSLTEEERVALRHLSEVFKEFIKRRPNMPMHQVVVMLEVALDEGKSLKHYSTKTDYPTSSVSRTFLDNGPKLRTGEEGLGLLEARPSAQNLREHETYLTVKGRKLFKDIARKVLSAGA